MLLDPLDTDFDASPSRTDLAKLELLAVQIEELSCQTPERIVNHDAQDIAGWAEINLTKMAFDLRQQIEDWRTHRRRHNA